MGNLLQSLFRSNEDLSDEDIEPRLQGISTPNFSTPSFNPRLFNHEPFSHEPFNHEPFNHEPKPKRIGPVQNDCYLIKMIWSVQNHFGSIEGQGISVLLNFN